MLELLLVFSGFRQERPRGVPTVLGSGFLHLDFCTELDFSSRYFVSASAPGRVDTGRGRRHGCAMTKVFPENVEEIVYD